VTVAQDSQDSQGFSRKRKDPAAPSSARAPGLNLKEIIEGSQGDFFKFCRLLRAHFPEKTTAEHVFDFLDPHLQRWGGWARYFARDDDGRPGVEDSETALALMETYWRRIRFLPGKPPLQQALEKASAHPLGTLRGKKRATPKYDRFVSVCGWLQTTVGDAPVYLPERKMAELLNTSPALVHAWLRWALEDGFLKCVMRYPPGTRRANEYRFDTSRWDVLTRHAARSCAKSFREGEVCEEAPGGAE